MLSIIIPTLNEAMSLPRSIPHARAAAKGDAIEIIVSDCGSTDATMKVAGELGAMVMNGAQHRADALNRGVANSRGEVLLFLHADTLLPDDFARRVRRALSDPRVVGGAFDFKFAPHPKHHGMNHFSLLIVTLCNRMRYRWSRNFYGDQGVFVRREVFDRLGGFPQVQLMEDLRFSAAMNRAGRTAILSPPVRTSARRFIHNGVMRQLFRDMMILSCDSFGMSPQGLWERYNRFNHRQDVVTFRAPPVPLPSGEVR